MYNQFLDIVTYNRTQKLPKNLFLFNPNKVLCEKDTNKTCGIYFKDSRYPTYTDSDHLTYYGSRILSNDFHEFIEQINKVEK